MKLFIQLVIDPIVGLGNALWFLGDVIVHIFKLKIRMSEVFKQIYEQGIQSIVIIALTSLASGLVLAMQGYVVLNRFGAKEFIAPLVALSLVRELSPVFTALIFSGKAGARIAAELGTMNVNDQMLATRTLGVDPIEYFIIPRMLACMIVLPILTVMSEVVGIYGGFLVGVYEAHVPASFYFNQTVNSIRFVDFFSGIIKISFFAFLIGWICCYLGYTTRGGSLGVGRFTTKAVACCYIFIIIFNAVLTKAILTLWG